MDVHLVDGTYELFRYFYSPSGRHLNGNGEPVGAVRGVLRSMVSLLEEGATHIGVATDHVITSFRNDLWPGYKTGEDVDPELFSQFPLLEDALRALGLTVWPMVEVEADDALGAAALVAAADPSVGRVLICTPDKDLAQCVGGKVVQFDRRAGQIRDAAAILDKYGVEPVSIPDWLALVGDSADGFPGIPGWGAKTAATVLRRYVRLEEIPHEPGKWDVDGVRGAKRLAASLADGYDDALLFKRLATLVTDIDVGTVEQWRWVGPASGRTVGSEPEQLEQPERPEQPEPLEPLGQWCERLDAPDVVKRVDRLMQSL